MKQYISLLENVIRNGVQKEDRTGTGTRSIFGWQMRFDLSKGFPLLTTKKLHFKSIAYELLWFIRGDTNIEYLNKNGVSIWDEWADENGDFRSSIWKSVAFIPTRDGGSIDQLLKVVKDIKNNPNSRRMIVSAWNPEYAEEMALPPCHCLFQFYVADNKLSCQLYQRSADIFLGVPLILHHIPLLTMIAKSCGLEASEFIITLGDAHLYDNHKEQANLQIKRELKNLPILKINKKDNIENYIYDDFEIIDYNPHPHISGKVAV